MQHAVTILPRVGLSTIVKMAGIFDTFEARGVFQPSILSAWFDPNMRFGVPPGSAAGKCGTGLFCVFRPGSLLCNRICWLRWHCG